MIVDTGSPINVISKRCADVLDLKIRTAHREMTIEGVTEGITRPLGTVSTYIKIDDREYKTLIYVLPAFKYGILLGLAFQKEHQVAVDHLSKSLRIGREYSIPLEVCARPWNPNSDDLLTASKKTSDSYVKRVRFEKDQNLDETQMMAEQGKSYDTLGSDIQEVCMILDAWEAEGWDHEVDPLEQTSINPRLSAPESKKVSKLLDSYQDLFSRGEWDIGSLKGVEADIQAKGEDKVIDRAWKLNPAKLNELDKHCHILETAGIIEKVKETEWLSNPVIVKKKASKNTRLTINYGQVNKCLPDLAMPVSDIDSIFDLLGGMKYKTVVDAKSGYFQVPLKDSARNITAFRGAHGFYRFTRLPQGLKTAPAIFQGIMNDIIGPLDGVCAKAYMDDVIIFSRTFEEHLDHVQQVFDRFRAAGLKLSKNKSVFAMTELPFLGRIITEEGTLPDPGKVEAITKFGRPRTTAELMRFRGMTNYHKRLIYNYSHMWKPLQELMNDPTIGWGTEQEKGYQAIIQAMTTAPVCAYPDWTRQFYISTDASSYAIGGVLKQKDDTGTWKIIANCSRMLKGSELNYPTTHLEALSIFYCIQQFEQYITGFKFTVITDHHSLCYLQRMSTNKNRLARWALYLQGFNFDVVYNPGKSHLDADSLSRPPVDSQTIMAEKPDITDPQVRCAAPELFPKSTMTEVQSLQETGWNFDKPSTTTTGTQTDSPEQIILALVDTETDDIETRPEADLRHLKERQRDHGTKTRPIIDYLEHGKVPSHCESASKYRKKMKAFEIRNDILCKWILDPAGVRKLVPYIPASLKQVVLEICHEHVLAGHMGRDKTYEKVRNNFFWTRMRQSVENHVHGCLICAKANVRRQATVGELMPLPATTTPGYEVSMDTITDLTKSSTGMRHIFVCTDRATRMVTTLAAPTKEPKWAVRLFRRVMCTFGLPGKVLTDWGGEYEGAFEYELKKYKIKHIRSLPYHPQTNGRTERKKWIPGTNLKEIRGRHPSKLGSVPGTSIVCNERSDKRRHWVFALLPDVRT